MILVWLCIYFAIGFVITMAIYDKKDPLFSKAFTVVCWPILAVMFVWVFLCLCAKKLG